MSGKGKGRAPSASAAETQPTAVESDEPDSRLTISNTDPAKRYFVYFIHESGRRGDNMPIKVGACNDVGEYRKEIEKSRENNLKTYSVLKCLKGDAEAVITVFVSKYSDNHIQNGWFTGGKAIVDGFIADMEKAGYERITEGRAKLLKGGARVAKNNSTATTTVAAATISPPEPVAMQPVAAQPKRPATPKSRK